MSYNQPRDGSSTVFEADKWIPLITPETKLISEGNLFGIVLVGNWPPKLSTTRHYEKLITQVKECFDPEDYESESGQPPAVYLYPARTLHITIATFTPFHISKLSNKEIFAQSCKEIMEKSFARKDWPKEPFQVEIDRAQIGAKAGIMLWENEDGTIEKMRKIILEEYNKLFETNSDVLNNRELTVPGIIHSTFMRFGRIPKTNGVLVQERFGEINIKELFERTKIEIDSVRLAIERYPYMHIPFNERHVLSSFEMKKDTS